MSSNEIDAVAAAALLKAISNPARLRIALCLLKGERSVTELEQELRLRQPNLSQHLAELRNANLAVSRREVKSVFYSLAGEDARRFISSLLQCFGGSAAGGEASAVGASKAPAVEVAKEPATANGSDHQAAVFAKVAS